MITFKQYINESSNVENIDTFFKQLDTIIKTKEKGDSFKDKRIFKTSLIANHFNGISFIFYNKLKLFHEYAVMLNMLSDWSFGGNSQKVVSYINKEIIRLYSWLQEFIVRLLKFYGSSNIEEEWFEFPEELERAGFTKDRIFRSSDSDDWESGLNYMGMVVCINMLNEAQTINDKIKAISLTLNVWHDSGPFFIKDAPQYLNDGSGIDGWWYGILTMEQLDYLSNIPERLIQRKLEKLIDNADILGY